MRRRLARGSSACLSLFLLLFLLPGMLAAATALKPSSGRAVKTAISPPLRELSAPHPDAKSNLPALWVRENEDRPASLHPRETGDTDGALQSDLASPTGGMPAPIVSFNALNNEDNATAFGGHVTPPDTDGAVGPTQYVQQVNLLLRVYDKTGAPLTPPTKLSSLFTSLGGACAGTDNGDPVVLYDALADRWILSQFALPSFPNPPYHECIAVSTSGDATGTYFVYDFLTPGAELPDYPKLSVWPDAYYMTVHQFTNGAAFNGSGVYALDRAKMLAGDPAASFVYFNLDATSHPEGIFGILASSLDGLTLPPAGAPEVFSYFTADEYGDPGDALRLFEFKPDFTTPASSTFTERPESPIALAAFDPRQPPNRTDVEQPAPGPAVDSVGDRLMYRMAYRVLSGGVQSYVLNFTVNVGGVTPNNAATYQAGIRWVELRRDAAGAISVHDQSTYAPGSGDPAAGPNRWTGSIAQDNQGNTALGFSVSSTTVFPSIHYAGRLASDPPGSLAQGEATLIDGTGVQTTAFSRWGDYSAMHVDPTDDCTFWYTNEYATVASQGTSTAGWLTRVGSFKYPACTAPPKGELSGTITDCGTASSLEGATITVSNGAYFRSSDASGNYSFDLPPGTYDVTVAKPGYASATSQVSVTNAAITTLDVCLQAVSLLGPAGSTLVAESCTPANGALDPGEQVTVSFCLENTGALSTADLVATLLPGGGVADPSGPQDYGVVVAGGPSVCASFTFTVNSACGDLTTATLRLQDGATNLGTVTFDMQTGARQVLFSEDFDSVGAPALPPNWVAANVPAAGALWLTSATLPDTAPNDAFVDDPNVVSDKRLDSPAFPVDTAAARVSFRNNYALEASGSTGYDGGVLEIKIGGGSFQDILAAGGSFVQNGYDHTISSGFGSPIAGRQAWSGSSGGYVTTIAQLPASANGQMVVLRWRMASDSTNGATGWRIDTVTVPGDIVCCSLPAPTALAVDASASGGASNVNGVFEPGERVVVAPTWMNGGTTATFTLNGAASAFDGPAGATYTLNDSAAAYGTLGHLASAQCTDCYEMSIDNPAVRPAAHWDASFTETPAMSAPTAGPPPKTWTLHVGASFADVPTSDLFYKFIETIFHNGVTGGCGAPGYCPANPALRKQMAVFLLKSRYGSAYVPPAAVGIFADVPQADTFAPWIEDLYNRGITGGCSVSPLKYCPDNTVLRQQMAVFLLKTLEGSTYVPPACTGVFPDVPCPSTFAPWIEDLAARGITGGCGGGNFCPAAPNTRGQMAVFLTKTFGLLLYGP